MQPYSLEMDTKLSVFKVAGKKLVALVVCAMFAMQMFCLHMLRARGGELRPGVSADSHQDSNGLE